MATTDTRAALAEKIVAYEAPLTDATLDEIERWALDDYPVHGYAQRAAREVAMVAEIRRWREIGGERLAAPPVDLEMLAAFDVAPDDMDAATRLMATQTVCNFCGFVGTIAGPYHDCKGGKLAAPPVSAAGEDAPPTVAEFDALEEYAGHLDHCWVVLNPKSRGDCDCGFVDALQPWLAWKHRRNLVTDEADDEAFAHPAAGSAEREDFFAGDPPPERGIPYPVDLSKLPPPAAGSAEREGESPEALAELISRLTDASWMRHPDEAEDMMVLRALCGEARVALEDYAALRSQEEG